MKIEFEAIYCLKDFKSFENIQLNKYCSNRKNNRLSTPELDVVTDLIKEYWCDLLASGYLNSKSCEEKKKIFKSVTIIFPYSSVPEAWTDGITYVDFTSYCN